MSPPINGGPTFRVLPGSAVMVGGPLRCMYHEITVSPLVLREWKCQAVYMRVTDQPLSRPYSGPDCAAVLDGINIMNQQPEEAYLALILRGLAPGQPMPDWFTVVLDSHRVGFHVYMHHNKKFLYAMVTRRYSPPARVWDTPNFFLAL